MSLITRQNKAGSGTKDYAKNTLIISDEVNTDFNQIYDNYDGHITNENIAPPGTANIDGAKLATGTVTTTQIAPNTILNVNVNANANIARTKLAAPVTLVTTILPGITFIGETTIATATLSPVGGGALMFLVAGALTSFSLSGTATVTFKWKRDLAVLGAPISYRLSTNGGDETPCPIPNFVDDDGMSGPHTWTLTAETSAGELATGDNGYVFAVEVR